MAVTTDPNAVYISYNGRDKQIVEKFISMLDERSIPHQESMSGPIDVSLTDFEEKIGSANIIVIFYSPDYFKSFHCMNEYANIRKNEKKRKNSIYYVKCADFKFVDISKDLMKFW